LGADGYEDFDRKTVRERLLKPYWDRSMQIRNAFKLGASVEEIADITKVDAWFLQQIRYMVSLENRTEGQALKEISKEDFFELKQAGFSDSQIAYLLSKSGEKVDEKKFGIDGKSSDSHHPSKWWIPVRLNSLHKLHTTILLTKARMKAKLRTRRKF
jgi:hypothetical protein